MIHKLARTKNLVKFMSSVEELIHRPHGTEGMGLLWGDPGEGKSTAIAYVIGTMDGIYVRAMGCWTVTTMLGQICLELGGHRMQRRADMIDWIHKQLSENSTSVRPIFVDEADYLFRQFDMMDALRDIYDLTGCPVILVGMEDIARKIQNHGRFARRITQWVKFEGLDLDDARIVADTCCEIHVADDLLRYLHREARANIGRIIIGLSRIEKFGKAGRLQTVTLDHWADRPLFYDQPIFGRRPAGAGGGN